MNFQDIFNATAVVGGMGIAIGLLLGLAGRVFQVETDEREELVLELLPGINCGACGYPGCDGCAAAITSGDASANACTVASSDTHVKIADLMGTKVETTVKQVAFVKCAGTSEKHEINTIIMESWIVERL